MPMEKMIRRLYKIIWYERQSLIEDGWQYVDKYSDDTIMEYRLNKNEHWIWLQLNFSEARVFLFRDGKLRKTIT